MLCTARASARQHLRAKEGVSENGVGGVAVAERDEGQAVDAHDVTRRKHDVVNAAHEEVRGCRNAARECPGAGYADRMPRCNKHRSCFCRITNAIILNLETAASVGERRIHLRRPAVRPWGPLHHSSCAQREPRSLLPTRAHPAAGIEFQSVFHLRV
jgi:hypothetical protein